MAEYDYYIILDGEYQQLNKDNDINTDSIKITSKPSDNELNLLESILSPINDIQQEFEKLINNEQTYNTTMDAVIEYYGDYKAINDNYREENNNSDVFDSIYALSDYFIQTTRSIIENIEDIIVSYEFDIDENTVTECIVDVIYTLNQLFSDDSKIFRKTTLTNYLESLNETLKEIREDNNNVDLSNYYSKTEIDTKIGDLQDYLNS